VYANPKAVETTGYSLEELIGQNPRVLKSGETPIEEYRVLWDKISTGHQWSGIFHNKKKNGSLYWESSSISPILDADGKIINYIAVKEDITEKKKINDDLIESEAKLKEANATKDKLFSIIGHDLRSSIGSFEPILELLTNEKNLDESEKTVLLNALIQGSKTAYSLLENLLSWASGQSNRLKLEPVNFIINDLIESSIELLASNARQKSITLLTGYNQPVSVYADRNTIDLVIRNLLGNAIKFTNENGRVIISLRENESEVEVTIDDNGVGMKKEVIDNLFAANSFYTTLGTNFEKGSGLGLVLCKDFVEKNGGAIRVESTPGAGSRFIFTIPKAAPVASKLS
jgi:PAS domain S-box-containing protein